MSSEKLFVPYSMRNYTNGDFDPVPNGIIAVNLLTNLFRDGQYFVMSMDMNDKLEDIGIFDGIMNLFVAKMD